MAIPLPVISRQALDRLALEVWRPLRPFILLALGYVVGSWALGAVFGWRGFALALKSTYYFGFIGAAALVAAGFVRTFREMRGASLAGAAGAALRGWQAPVARMLIVAVLGGLSLSTLTGWRVAIPELQSFTWDRTFDAIDVGIHGGVRPWELTHAIFGETVTRALGWVYGPLWFIGNIAVIVAAALLRPSRTAMRVLVAYILQYAILGGAMAVAFASVGPCYFGRHLGLDPRLDPYAALNATLHAVHDAGRFSPVLIQDYLWRHFEAGTIGLGTGITAFPSLHVSSGVLLALAGWSIGRVWGAVGTMLAVVLFVGSVHLGWHYAVDGYASLLGMLGLWWLAGRLVPAPRDPPDALVVDDAESRHAVDQAFVQI